MHHPTALRFAPSSLALAVVLASACQSEERVVTSPSAAEAGVADSAVPGADAGASAPDAGGDCTPGDVRPCYSGPDHTRARGACRDGNARCDASGRWSGSCEGAVVPAARETCGDGLDDDCDGRTDEGCSDCVPGTTRLCYPGPVGTEGVGTCAAGAQRCQPDGRWDPTCEGAVLPSATEACDGADDDCDGAEDELGVLTCGVGACARTIDRCVSGVEQACMPGEPAPESCNGVDDDCDGTTDEDIAPIRCGTGACARTTAGCTEGAPAVCTPAASQPELCNGIDDDCDERVDEHDARGGAACTTSRPGICATGTSFCEGGELTCRSVATPRDEICNRLDDDCDGSVDEHRGRESCNLRDDDCDGRVDEGNPGGGASCTTSSPGICSTGTVWCGSAALRCIANELPRGETCNGLDDDCDGRVDEHRRAERCDGVDEDCDGRVDEQPADGITYYLDCDGDRHPAADAETVVACRGTPPPPPAACPAGHYSTLTGDDCNDRDARAFVTQTEHFTTPMSTPNSFGLVWDFDCDGMEEVRWQGSGSACGPLVTCRNTGAWESAPIPGCGEAASWVRCELTPDGTRCGTVRSSRVQQCR